jgi:sporulation protein YlmC with PRC-barrel domain
VRVTIALEDIIGDEVVSADAKIIGEVEGIAIDINTWRAPVVRIGLNKGVETSVGIKKPMFGAARLYIESLYVEHVSDLVTLSKKLGDLKNFSIDQSQIPLMAGDIVGKRVVCRKGREIGAVESIMFDTKSTWTVPYFKVRLEKAVVEDLKLKKPLLKTPLISIATKDVRTVGDLVMLAIEMDQLKDMLERG